MLKSTSTFLRQLGFTHPGILVDEEQARSNIRLMVEKAQANSVLFRPHFKTHHSSDVGKWFSEEGVTAITVSSVKMAEYFAAHGWYDITIAFLLNPLEWPRIKQLAIQLKKHGGSLALTIDSLTTANWLSKQSEIPLGVWIKFDAGYGRTGVGWQDHATLKSIVEQLEDKFPIHGLLTHSGHSYHTESRQELRLIWNRTRHRMEAAQQFLGRELILSVGDTPCCRSLEKLAGVQEIRPGNFVFYDLMQWSQGVCETRELAAAAVCPVVGVYPDRNRIVIHGGAVHLSKESIGGSSGQDVFGYLGALSPQGSDNTQKLVLDEAPVISLSQEHGTIEIPTKKHERYFGEMEIGDLVLVWPVHSCLTCNLAEEYRTMTGTILSK